MRRFLTLLGLAFCILPPCFATLAYFPLWLTEKESSLSAFALLLLLLSAIPLFKFLRAHIKSYAAWMFWLVLFLALSAFRAIADGLWTISLLALIGSAAGTVCFALAKTLKKN